MSLTKEQKKDQVRLASDSIKESQNVIFVDFSGISDEASKQLKNELLEKGAKVKVLKKRLLSIALKEAGIEFETMQEKTPLATIFSPVDLSEVAGTINKFGRQFKDTESKFEVLGVYDKEAGEMISREQFLVIANLPSREVLLAQVMGGITGPLRAFMSIVSQLAEKQEVGEGDEVSAVDEKKEDTVAQQAKVEDKSKEATEPEQSTVQGEK